MKNRFSTINYHIMLLPAIVFIFIFNIIPLCGSVLAFKEFKPKLGIWGSQWVGLDNYKYLFSLPDFPRTIYNTLFIAFFKILFSLFIPLVFALLLNEIRKLWFKKAVQTIIYIPYFLSWVILAGIFKDLFSTTGLVNSVLGMIFGMESVMFFANIKAFPWIVIFTDIWKNYGFNAIIYLAALISIDVALYESARIDGASRWKQLTSITLPGIVSTIILLATLSLQNILNAGFDQIFNLYNPLVYETGDILDTYLYRMGLISTQFEMATAIGLLKSFVGFLMIFTAYTLSEKFAKYRIF